MSGSLSFLSICTHLHPDSKTHICPFLSLCRLPLFQKGRESYHFEYGVFLLNKVGVAGAVFLVSASPSSLATPDVCHRRTFSSFCTISS